MRKKLILLIISSSLLLSILPVGNIKKKDIENNNIKLLVNYKNNKIKKGTKAKNTFATIGYNTTNNNPNNGYCFWYGINYSNSNWMAGINNNTRLSELSIPGTHDTMSYKQWGNYLVQTQTMNLQTQLNSGIRFLDIRCEYNNGNLYLHHGPIYLGGTLENVFQIVSTFLKAHPTETVLMRISKVTNVPNSIFNKALKKYMAQFPGLFFNSQGESLINPTLGQMRGKVVILNDVAGTTIGINYKWLNAQDNYDLGSDWGLYNKWLDIKKQIIAANNSNYDSITSTPYINYLSGANGVFPYFVASGHITPSTWAGFLWTGVLSNQKSYDPDFPRFGDGIYFEGTDFLATNYIENHDLNYIGIVAADFPGAGLINSIINVNKNNFVNGIQYENGNKYYINNGKIITNNWININSQGQRTFAAVNGNNINAYYIGANGLPEKGLEKIDGEIQYLNPINGKMELNKFITINGNTYYLQPVTGQAAIGWKIIDGNKYYFNSNGVMVKGYQIIDGKNYYFNEISGIQETGVQKTPSGLEYFTNKPISGEEYGQAIFYTGWLNIGNQIYYFGANSKALTGIQIINNETYYFNSNGKLNIGETKLLNSKLWLYGTPDGGWDVLGSLSFSSDSKIKVFKGNESIGLIPNKSINPDNGDNYYLKIQLENKNGNILKSLILNSNISGRAASEMLYNTFNNVTYSNLDKIVITSIDLDNQIYAVGTSTQSTNIINGANSIWSSMNSNNNSQIFIINSNVGVIESN